MQLQLLCFLTWRNTQLDQFICVLSFFSRIRKWFHIFDSILSFFKILSLYVYYFRFPSYFWMFSLNGTFLQCTLKNCLLAPYFYQMSVKLVHINLLNFIFLYDFLVLHVQWTLFTVDVWRENRTEKYTVFQYNLLIFCCIFSYLSTETIICSDVIIL